MKPRILAVVGLALVTLLLAGCEQKTINQILAEPSRYQNREVVVVGTVTQGASILGRGAYQIDDGTGKLWVISGKGVPREGARVAVKGTIKDVVDVGSFIKLPGLPFSSGIVMMETERPKARRS